jgi:tRNA nucleotidyltransferase (CCA-adding enzyme)
MRKLLNKLPYQVKQLISLVGDLASKDKTPVYLVGGFVRDLFLDAGNLDLDIVVEGDGIRFAERLSSSLKAKLTRHRRFGTATIALNPELKVDVSTARKEHYPHPACLPVVSSGTMQDDLFRRDFTINAMALSIAKNDFGRLLDPFGGRDDLTGRKIRILHDLSFIDDPTRILRAVRFEQRFNFKIEANTLQRIKEAVKLAMLSKVNPHRIRDDLILILKEKDPPKEIKRINNLIGFGFLDAKVSLSANTYSFLRSASSQIRWFEETSPSRRPLDKWLIYFSCLIDNLTPAAAKNLCSILALRNGEEKRILCYKNLPFKLVKELSKRQINPFRLFEILEPLSYEVIILVMARQRNNNLKKNISAFLKFYNGLRIHISGMDLRKLGVSPGPGYQKIFRKVLEARLNGRVSTREEEILLAEKIIKSTLAITPA